MASQPDAEVRVGGNLVLTCTIIAEPTANFSEIVRIMPNGEKNSLNSNNNPMGDRRFLLDFMFRNARFPQDDGAIFQCRATNANGEAARNLTITVQGELYIEYPNIRVYNIMYAYHP